MKLHKRMQELGLSGDEAAIVSRLTELGLTIDEVSDADLIGLVGQQTKAIAPATPQSSITSTKGRKIAKTANKNDQPIAPAQSVELQKAIDSGKEDLHTHFDALNQIGLQVASAKVEMSRAMPQIIAQKVDELLAANPIDTDAGARRVREAMMSEAIQAMLTDMGLEFSYE